MVVTSIGNNIFLGLSSDTKPTTSPSQAIFIETDNRRIYIYNGTVWNELVYASTGASDLKVLVKEAGSTIGAGAGRSLNFTTGTDFDIAEDTTNDEYDIGIADNAIGDAEIIAHTTTKITSPKSLIPATVAYEDESNTFSSGQVFQVESVFNVQQKHLRLASQPANPDADTGLTYLYQLDTNNDIFGFKAKIGGQFHNMRAF